MFNVSGIKRSPPYFQQCRSAPSNNYSSQAPKTITEIDPNPSCPRPNHPTTIQAASEALPLPEQASLQTKPLVQTCLNTPCSTLLTLTGVDGPGKQNKKMFNRTYSLEWMARKCKLSKRVSSPEARAVSNCPKDLEAKYPFMTKRQNISTKTGKPKGQIWLIPFGQLRLST